MQILNFMSNSLNWVFFLLPIVEIMILSCMITKMPYGRNLRNILDQVVMNQNLRTEDEKDNQTIIIDDVEDYLTDEGIDLKKSAEKKRTIGFA